MRINTKHIQTATSLRPYRTPEGWLFLGEGTSREAYRGPDNMVYKVPRHNFDQSEEEHRVVWELKRTSLPEWLVIPKVYFHSATGISVMEYMDGIRPMWCGRDCECVGMCVMEKVNWISNKLGLIDMHLGNLIVLKDGRLAIIDLGI